MEKGRTGKDCVVVALSNHFSKPYPEVLKMLYENITDFAKENHYKNGFFASTYVKVFEILLGRKAKVSKPRRGAEKLTGLVTLHRPGRKHGHLVFMLCGNVIEVDEQWIPIDDYRRMTGMCIRAVYQ